MVEFFKFLTIPIGFYLGVFFAFQSTGMDLGSVSGISGVGSIVLILVCLMGDSQGKGFTDENY